MARVVKTTRCNVVSAWTLGRLVDRTAHRRAGRRRRPGRARRPSRRRSARARGRRRSARGRGSVTRRAGCAARRGATVPRHAVRAARVRRSSASGDASTQQAEALSMHTRRDERREHRSLRLHDARSYMRPGLLGRRRIVARHDDRRRSCRPPVRALEPGGLATLTECVDPAVELITRSAAPRRVGAARGRGLAAVGRALGASRYADVRITVDGARAGRRRARAGARVDPCDADARGDDACAGRQRTCGRCARAASRAGRRTWTSRPPARTLDA